MDSELRLLTVHAHPDDEASKGAGTVARYAAEGIRSTLVCCTGGEAGDVLNPAMDRPEVRADIAAVRRRELEAATEAIGYHEFVMLGYRDSGMPDTEFNAHPAAFANAPLDEAVGKLVAEIRRVRPQVIVTYSDDQRGYQHPDHIMVNTISVPAWERAGDPDWYPEAGPAWTPSKLYYVAWARRRIEALHAAFLEHGLESPFDARWFERESNDHRITSRVDVGPWYHQRSAGLLAHATQVDPTSPFWFGLPDEVAAEVYPWEDYELVESRVPTSTPEDDLFAGLRQPVTVG